MVKQPLKKSPLAGLASSLKQSHQKHKDDETKYGMVEMPGGIQHGLAQLTKCHFDTVKKAGKNLGKPFFYAEAVCISPESVVDPISKTVVVTKGLRTSIYEPLFATPEAKGEYARRTLDDHYAEILNQLRKLGVDTSEIEPDDLDGVCEGLVADSPTIKFSTRQGQVTPQYPTPRVFHAWNGIAEGVEGEGDIEGGTEDDSADGEDLDALAAAADEGDQDSISRLEEMGKEAGFTAKQMNAIDTYTELLDQIRNVGSEEGGEEEAVEEGEETEGEEEGEEGEESAEEGEEGEEVEEEWEPHKGGTCLYYPIDAKTNKPVRKAVDCEVIALNKKAGTADLKNLATKKLYKGVKTSSLSQPD